MRFLIALVLTLPILAGCTLPPDPMTETIYLENTEGKVVLCGPYKDTTIGDYNSRRYIGRESLRNCVTDYQLAGYRRIPKPVEE